LRAIFRTLIDDQKIRVEHYYTDDSALVAAETFMLLHPARYIAVILETWSEDPKDIRDVYFETGRRRLERSARSDDQWHLALAIPDLRAWAVIDDHVRQEYEKIRQDPAIASTPEEGEKVDQANYRALASKIGEWTAEYPFDLEKLKRESRQVRELCAFIHKSQHPEPRPVLATAADWF
jgi:hypothetical protein